MTDKTPENRPPRRMLFVYRREQEAAADGFSLSHSRHNLDPEMEWVLAHNVQAIRGRDFSHIVIHGDVRPSPGQLDDLRLRLRLTPMIWMDM